MDPERWKSVESLYHAALDLDPSRRASFLDSACAGDPALRHEVESLIGYADQAGGMLEARPVMDPPPETAPVFQPGDVLNQRFRVVQQLGAGGMGEVYEAEDLVLGEPVALKTIRPDLIDQQMLRARLIEEVQAAKRIAHPGICRIHDLHLYLPAGSPSGDILFLTMELLRGETLGARIWRSGRMEIREALPIVEQLAGALSAAHRARVIHRDLKSENIVLESSPSGAVRAVITDFGLARNQSRSAHAKRLTRTGQIVGTLAYMAPEQLLGKPVTPAADIYAFGIVLFEMVTGRPPFEGGSNLALAARRLTSPPPSPRSLAPNLPREWERAILCCLEREPENRFADATEAWHVVSGKGTL